MRLIIRNRNGCCSIRTVLLLRLKTPSLLKNGSIYFWSCQKSPPVLSSKLSKSVTSPTPSSWMRAVIVYSVLILPSVCSDASSNLLKNLHIKREREERWTTIEFGR